MLPAIATLGPGPRESADTGNQQIDIKSDGKRTTNNGKRWKSVGMQRKRWKPKATEHTYDMIRYSMI
jgi:hypothetical protein